MEPANSIALVWLIGLFIFGNWSRSHTTISADLAVLNAMRRFAYLLRETLIVAGLTGLMAILFAWPVYGYLTE